MIKSETTKELFSALVKARTEIATVNKDKAGYGYKYATLDNVLNMLKEVLPKYGLGFIQSPETIDGHDGVTTTIIHDSGEFISTRYELEPTPVKGTNITQQRGASITYARRYSLCSAFGIATEEDLDGNAGRRDDSPVRKDQLDELYELGANDDVLCQMFKVDSVAQITETQATALIKAKQQQLERLKAKNG